MGILYLVRHAQASFLELNYDKLSELGETQARLLGEYWAQRKLVFDRVCAGPCARQKDTARIVGDAYEKEGLKFPVPLMLPEFDEYQADAALERSLPGLLKSDQSIRDLHAAFQTAGSAGRRVAFQRLFEAVIGRWVEGAISLPGVETWSEFCIRVDSGLSRILGNCSRGERIAIVTSGGPIAVAMQRALSLSPVDTLRLSWMSRNCSWSEFLYSGDRFTLSTFNNHAHLDDVAMLTYR
jgi:broad specificity phosphatase PhoE